MNDVACMHAHMITYIHIYIHTQGSRIFVEDLVEGGPAEESGTIDISDLLVSVMLLCT